METFFSKINYCFLVESSKIKNASFSYKSAISEANVKTNSMERIKWTYGKNRGLPVTNLVFRKSENFCKVLI